MLLLHLSLGQSKPKNSPTTGTANYPNFPAVGRNNLAAKIQPQTQTDGVPGLMAPNVKVEKMRALLGRYSRPVIFYSTENPTNRRIENWELTEILFRFAAVYN